MLDRLRPVHALPAAFAAWAIGLLVLLGVYPQPVLDTAGSTIAKRLVPVLVVIAAVVAGIVIFR